MLWILMYHRTIAKCLPIQDRRPTPNGENIKGLGLRKKKFSYKICKLLQGFSWDIKHTFGFQGQSEQG